MQKGRMYSGSSSRPLYHSSSSRAASEQKLMDEVSYLHYLWQQGPPSKRKRGEQPPAESRKKPRIEEKKKKKKNRRKNKNKNKKEEGASENADGQQKNEELKIPIDGNWNPESLWDTQNPSVNKDWASEENKTELKPLTEEEQIQLGQLKLQRKAAKAFREFLTKDQEDESFPSSSDDDEEEEEEDEEKEDGNDNGEKGGHFSGALAMELEVQKVFDKMFEEDEELKRFYEQNCNCGSFECLVCVAIGEKAGKKFPDCVSLIQHAMKILKTKKKKAHRGYGRAICCLLGWNMDRLPSVAKPPNSDLKPRACIPPPDEDEGQASEEGGNGKGTVSDGERAASDDNDAKEEMDSDGGKEASDDNDTKEEMDSDGEKEASDDNDTKEEMDSDGEKEASDDNDAKNDQEEEPALD